MSRGDSYSDIRFLMQRLFVCREILCIALAAEGLVFEMLSNIMTHFHSDDLLMRLLIK